MAFAKRVVGEILDGVEQLFSELLAVATLNTASFKDHTLLFHVITILFSACFAQIVCFLKAVTGKLLGNAHHALLIDHQSVCVTKKILCVFMKNFWRFSLVFIVGIVIVHICTHRTGSIKSNDRR